MTGKTQGANHRIFFKQCFQGFHGSFASKGAMQEEQMGFHIF
jgi:hypothetical protein